MNKKEPLNNGGKTVDGEFTEGNTFRKGYNEVKIILKILTTPTLLRYCPILAVL